jgi:hypothetical protein
MQNVDSGGSPGQSGNEPGPSYWHWVHYLFLRPRQFFEHFVVRPAPALTLLAAWLMGVVAAMDRVEQKGFGSRSSSGSSLFAGSMEDWQTFWVQSLLLGVVSGAMYYLLGGWWYRTRLEFCGARAPDPALARRVYLFASLVAGMPALLYKSWESRVYATPLDAFQGDDAWGLAVLVFLFWSAITSYQGVRTAFIVRPGPARLWFLILPLLAYGVVVAGTAGVLLSGNGVAEPQVSRPKRVSGTGCTLEIPGNWKATREGPGQDGAETIQIEPPFADAVLHVTACSESQSLLGPEELLEEVLDSYAQAFPITRGTPVDAWGRHPGRGVHLEATIEGTRCRGLAFVSVREDRWLQVFQLSQAAVAEHLEPGFALVRESFAWRDGN